MSTNRMSNSIINVSYNVFFFIMQSILLFLSKSILIKYFGDELTGINTVLVNVVGMLGLVELGIGQAVIYSLYTPLREKDYTKLNNVLSLYKAVYRIMAVAVAMIALIIGCFIGDIVKLESVSLGNLQIYFILYVINALLTYLMTYKQILIIADQKSYIIAKIAGLGTISRLLCQIVTGIIFKNYIVWIVLEILHNFITYWYINKKIQNQYTWLANSPLNIKLLFKQNKQILRDTKSLFIHKLSGIVINQTDSIVLSVFTNLKMVTIYGNYTMITRVVINLITKLLEGIKASIGDLIAEGNNEACYKIWKDIYYLLYMILVIATYLVYFNIEKFMELWVGKDYTFDNITVLIISITLFIQLLRLPTDIFKEGYGLFWDKYIPVIEVVMNLGLSIGLVKVMGVRGVVLGTLVSGMIVCLIWRPFLIFKYGFKKPVRLYYLDLMKLLIITILSITLSNGILKHIGYSSSNTLIEFLVYGIYSSVAIAALYVAVAFCCSNEYRKIYYRYSKTIIKTLKRG